MSKHRPRCYFSFRSPFSWIATRMLGDRLTLPEKEALEWIPFWEPSAETLARLRAEGGDFLYQQMTREKHLYILQDVKRLTRSLGYQHVWPIDDNPPWEVPNLAYLAAARLGKAVEFRDAVFRARWELDLDIHRLDVLQRIGGEVGIDPGLIGLALEDPTVKKEAVDRLLRIHADGVFGIPFFVIGFQKLWGLDRLEAFVAALRGQAHRFYEGTPFPAEVQAEWDDEESALWKGIPRQVLCRVGVLDQDSAGGCG